MRGSWLIFKKEIYYWTKDRRTLLWTLFFPIIFYPPVFGVMTKMGMREGTRLTKTSTLVLLEDPANILSATLFEEGTGFNRVSVPPDNIPEALSKEQIHLSIIVAKEANTSRKLRKPVEIQITYDPSKAISSQGFSKIKTFLKVNDDAIVSTRLNELRISPEILVPTRINTVKTTGANEQIGKGIGMFLPYFLLISMFGGAVQFGADITAGEKERGTLISLLTTRLTRLEIMQGKMFAIFTVALLGLVMNLVGLALGAFTAGYIVLSNQVAKAQILASNVRQSLPSGMDNIDFQSILNPQVILIILSLMIPMGLFFSAIILTVGAQSKSVKEANVAIIPGFVVLIFVGVASFAPGVEKLGLLPFIPIMNITVVIKKLFTNQFVVWEYLIAFLMTSVLCWLMVTLSGRLLSRESALFKS